MKQDILNPKVTEPQGFGAIVEAGWDGGHVGTRYRFFNNGSGYVDCSWTREGDHPSQVGWSDLINPTILSEGLNK